MFRLKIVLLSTIALSSLFANCNAADDVLSKLRNAFQTEFDNFAETVDQQSLIEDRASRINEHYNDAKCYEQTAILMQAVNASEQWALKGKPNMRQNDLIWERWYIELMFDLSIESAESFERSVGNMFCDRFSIGYFVPIEWRVLSRFEFEAINSTQFVIEHVNRDACNQFDCVYPWSFNFRKPLPDREKSSTI